MKGGGVINACASKQRQLAEQRVDKEIHQLALVIGALNNQAQLCSYHISLRNLGT